jgi:hypothetical protein
MLMEAQALGIPVVSTVCPTGPSDIIADGATGLLAPCRDPKALAQAIFRCWKMRISVYGWPPRVKARKDSFVLRIQPVDGAQSNGCILGSGHSPRYEQPPLVAQIPAGSITSFVVCSKCTPSFDRRA